MGFNAQYKNHNAQYGALRYGALGGSIYASNFTETASSGQSFTSAAGYHAVIAETAVSADNDLVIAIFNAAYSDGVSTADQLVVLTICNLSYSEAASAGDTETMLDLALNGITESLLSGDAVNAVLLCSILVSEFATALDAQLLFSNSNTPALRLFSVLKEKRNS